MVKVKAIKIVGGFLILVFTCNTALASTARCNLKNFSKIHHTGKKSASKKITLEDPNANDDFKAVFHSVKHRTRRLFNSYIAIVIPGSASVTLNSVCVVLPQTSQPYSNNLSDIFIPPKKIV